MKQFNQQQLDQAVNINVSDCFKANVDAYELQETSDNMLT